MDDDTGGWCVLIFIGIIVVVCGSLLYRAGYNDGARDHAKGLVVVVSLPDGTDRVVTPKPVAQPLPPGPDAGKGVGE